MQNDFVATSAKNRQDSCDPLICELSRCIENHIFWFCFPACDCNGMSRRCYFDQALFDRTGHGGHCTDCQYNTAGPNCERCQDGFFRYSPQDRCQACNCHPVGSYPQNVVNSYFAAFEKDAKRVQARRDLWWFWPLPPMDVTPRPPSLIKMSRCSYYPQGSYPPLTCYLPPQMCYPLLWLVTPPHRCPPPLRSAWRWWHRSTLAFRAKSLVLTFYVSLLCAFIVMTHDTFADHPGCQIQSSSSGGGYSYSLLNKTQWTLPTCSQWTASPIVNGDKLFYTEHKTGSKNEQKSDTLSQWGNQTPQQFTALFYARFERNCSWIHVYERWCATKSTAVGNQKA